MRSQAVVRSIRAYRGLAPTIQRAWSSGRRLPPHGVRALHLAIVGAERSGTGEARVGQMTAFAAISAKLQLVAIVIINNEITWSVGNREILA